MNQILQRWAPAAALTAMALQLLRQGLAPASNDDTYFHLRIGDEFLSGWKPWHPGHLSAGESGDWVPTQWLSQLAMAGLERAGGSQAVVVLATALATTFVATVWWTARHRASPLAAAVVTTAVFAASAPALSARPQLVSFLLVAVCLRAWLKSADDGRVRWWLIPLGWLWAMLHGMWPVGIVLAIAAVTGIALDRRDPAWARRASLVPLGMLAGAFLTPAGPTLPAQVLTVTGRAGAFEEWAAPDYTSPTTACLALLFALTLVALTQQGRTTWTLTLLLLVAAGAAVYSTRTVPVAAVLVAPVAAAALQRSLGRATRAGRAGRRAVLTGAAAIVAVTALGAPFQPSPPPAAGSTAAGHLDALPPGTVVLNSWKWGGQLMWQHPDLAFVLHGYGDLFTDAELADRLRLTRTSAGWREALSASGARVAVLDADEDLAYELRSHEAWQLVFEDDQTVLYRLREQ